MTDGTYQNPASKQGSLESWSASKGWVLSLGVTGLKQEP